MDNAELKNELIAQIREATDYRKKQRDPEYINNLAHYENTYWNLATYSENSPFVLRSDINHYKNAIDLRAASLYALDYTGDLKPKTAVDRPAIENMNIIQKYEFNRMKMGDHIKRGIKDILNIGDAYVELSFDADKIEGGTGNLNEGFLKTNYIHASEIYLDPAGEENIETCEFIVRKKPVTKNWLKRVRPEWYAKLTEENKNVPDSSFGADNGEIYVDRNYTERKKNVFLLETVYRKEPGTKEIEVLDAEGQPTGMFEKINYTKVVIYYMINGILLETNDKYPFDFYPIEKLSCEDIPQCPYGIPLGRGLTVAQKVANLIESAINNAAMHGTIPSWLLSDEAGIDITDFSTFQAALGMAWLVSGEPSKAVTPMPYPQVDKNLVEYGSMYVNYIREYAGVNRQFTGDIGSAGNTKGGTESAIARATIIDALIIAQIEKFIERYTRKMMKFIYRYYADRTITIRTEGKKGPTFKEYTVDKDIENVDNDFDIDLSYKTKNDKDRQFEKMVSIWQMQNQYKDKKPLLGPIDIVKAAQLDNYPDLLRRDENMSEEAWAEKINLALQLLPTLDIVDETGQPLITSEEFQQGMIDIFNDDNSLDVVSGILDKVDQYNQSQQQIDKPQE